MDLAHALGCPKDNDAQHADSELQTSDNLPYLSQAAKTHCTTATNPYMWSKSPTSKFQNHPHLNSLQFQHVSQLQSPKFRVNSPNFIAISQDEQSQAVEQRWH